MSAYMVHKATIAEPSRKIALVHMEDFCRSMQADDQAPVLRAAIAKATTCPLKEES